MKLSTLFILLLSSTAHCYGATQPASPIDVFQTIKASNNIGAVSYALVEGNKIITTGGLGQKSLLDTTPVNADSILRVGSITKTFTALALMKLVEKKRLQLEQPIRNLLPDVPLANPYLTSPITLAMLLEHTAGLKDLSRKEFNYPSPLSLKQAFQVEPNARKVLWEPGNFKSYSNAGAGYVSAAIEQITRQDYDQWFNKSILAQMGMHNSQLNWSKKLEQSLVAGYDADLKTAIPYWHTLYRAFGNLNTSANDMAKFLLLLINNGTVDGKIIFRASSIQRMETPKTSLAARQGLTLGYGLGIRSELYEGHRLYQHGGDADGYLAHFAYNKDSRRGYFIVINAFRHDILAEFKSALNDWLIENLPPPKPLPTAKITPEHLQTLSGNYSPATYRFSPKQGQAIEIKMVKNTLYLGTGDHGDGVKLIPVSKWLFRKPDEPEASVAFVFTADGKLNMHNDSGAFQKQ